MTGHAPWTAEGRDLSHTSDGPSIALLADVSDALRGLKFGQVTISVQDGVVVQIDRLEKYRLGKPELT